MSHLSDKKKPSLAWIIKEVINPINPSLSNWVTDGTWHPVMQVMYFTTTHKGGGEALPFQHFKT